MAQPDQYESGDCVELRAYTNAQAHDNLTSANLQFFPNIEIALRIYLCLMVPNCSGERSFSKRYQEPAAFDDASRSFKSCNVDEPRT